MAERKREEWALMATPSGVLAFGFGAGLSPIAPGTCGTILAMPLYLLLATQTLYVYIAILLGLFAIGVWVSDRIVKALGRQDPQAVVWDEMVGYWITMLPAPEIHWLWMILGFILFRLFDILKPWPIRGMDREIGGGMGAMVDDALAGVYAAGVMAAIGYGFGLFP